MASRWIGTGLVVVISSPSGGGKSTVIRRLRDRHPEFLFSVSTTTRPRRPGERSGTHYRFVTSEQFLKLKSQRAFAEWARVHDHYYGTPKANLVRAYRMRRVLLLDLDVQGAASLKRADSNVVTVFLQPPSFAVLKKRLLGRRTEGAAERSRRLANAKMELERRHEYDYLVTNDRLEQCVSDCEAVVRAETLRQREIPGRR